MARLFFPNELKQPRATSKYRGADVAEEIGRRLAAGRRPDSGSFRDPELASKLTDRS